LIPPPEPHDNPNYLENYNDWLVFHTKNPNVYVLICEHAQEAMDAGHVKYGMGAIFELIVWHYAVRMANPDLNFKMPHNHRAFYARMWVKNNPAYPKFLQLKEQPSRWLKKPKTDKFGQPI
jgi:hypothetical protein